MDDQNLLNQRVRALAMTGPLHRLQHSVNWRDDTSFQRQDLRSLALVAIDLCVMRMEADTSSEIGATEDELVEAMRPFMLLVDSSLDRDQSKRIGQAVLTALMNEAREAGELFAETYIRYDGDRAIEDRVLFSLLRRSRSGDGTIVIRATHQAINLSLNMLIACSLDDQAVAERIIATRHLLGGRLDQARASAERASIASLGFCNRINDVLNQAREDAVRADWPRLNQEIVSALDHLREVQASDSQSIKLIVTECARADARGDEAHAFKLRHMRLQVERCQMRHNALLSRLIAANADFERCYRTQAYRTLVLAPMQALGPHAVHPGMGIYAERFDAIAHVVGARLLLPVAPVLVDPLDLAVQWLEEVPLEEEADEDVIDDGELVDAEPKRFTRQDHELVRAFLTREVFANSGTTQLSSLALAARADGMSEAQIDLLVLWVLTTHIKHQSGELKGMTQWQSMPLDSTVHSRGDVGPFHWGHPLLVGATGGRA